MFISMGCNKGTSTHTYWFFYIFYTIIFFYLSSVTFVSFLENVTKEMPQIMNSASPYWFPSFHSDSEHHYRKDLNCFWYCPKSFYLNTNSHPIQSYTNCSRISVITNSRKWLQVNMDSRCPHIEKEEEIWYTTLMHMKVYPTASITTGPFTAIFINTETPKKKN